jgi:hypothetical protein
MVRKTHRRQQTKRKTSRRRIHKRRTIRHRKGGRLNQPNNNNAFDDRRSNLINALQDIIDQAEQASQQQNVDAMTFVNEIRAYENEADAIDAHYNNNDMEDMLNQRIEDVMHIFGLINQNGNMNVNNNNNANTIPLPNYNRINNNNNNNRLN